MVSFPQVSPPKPCIRLTSTPYALHAPPISFFSILSPEQYWVSSTDHSAVQIIQLLIMSFLDFKIHYIILPSMPTSSKWSLSFVFPRQCSVYSSLPPHMYYMPCPHRRPASEQPTLGEGTSNEVLRCAVLSNLPLHPQSLPQHPALSLSNILSLLLPQYVIQHQATL